MADGLTNRQANRPWHGASDRVEDPAVAALRLHRAEVEALMSFRLAAQGEACVLAWWRLQQLRRQRRAVQPAIALAPLPPPPEGALGWWQGVRMRLNRLEVEAASPPSRITRRLREG